MRLRSKGMMTVEASLVLSISLICIGLLMVAGFYVYDIEVLDAGCGYIVRKAGEEGRSKESMEGELGRLKRALMVVRVEEEEIEEEPYASITLRLGGGIPFTESDTVSRRAAGHHPEEFVRLTEGIKETFTDAD